MRRKLVPWLVGGVDRLRSSLYGLLALFSLIALSILVVWPLWYVATNHTHAYSIAILLLAGGSLVPVILSRAFLVFGSAGLVGKRTGSTGVRLPGPREHGE